MRTLSLTIYLTAATFLAGVPQTAMAGGCGVYGGTYSYAPSYSYGTYQPYAYTTYSYAPVKTYYQQPVAVLTYQTIEVPLYSVGGTGYRTAAPQTVSSTTTTTTTASATTAGTTAAATSVNGVPQASVSNAAATTAATTCEAKTAALQRDLDALRAKFEALSSRAVDPVPQQQQGFRVGNRAALGAFATKCAVCHTAATADEFGGGKILAAADGSLAADVAPALLTKIVTKSYSGAMPPKNNAKGVAALTDNEVAEIMADVERMQKVATK